MFGAAGKTDGYVMWKASVLASMLDAIMVLNQG